MPAYDFNMVPATELDAINIMLMSIGQSPVNTLEVSGIKTVNMARLTLHNISREVQSEGWNFNTDESFPLSRDGNNKVSIPSNALDIDPCDKSKNYVQRRDPTGDVMRFYDKDNFTFALDSDPKVDVTWFFEFEDMPQTARAYIYTKAARVFQANQIGSQLVFEFTKERETETQIAFERAESKSRDANFFNLDPAAARIARRI